MQEGRTGIEENLTETMIENSKKTDFFFENNVHLENGILTCNNLPPVHRTQIL